MSSGVNLRLVETGDAPTGISPVEPVRRTAYARVKVWRGVPGRGVPGRSIWVMPEVLFFRVVSLMLAACGLNCLVVGVIAWRVFGLGAMSGLAGAGISCALVLLSVYTGELADDAGSPEAQGE